MKTESHRNVCDKTWIFQSMMISNGCANARLGGFKLAKEAGQVRVESAPMSTPNIERVL